MNVEHPNTETMLIWEMLILSLKLENKRSLVTKAGINRTFALLYSSIARQHRIWRTKLQPDHESTYYFFSRRKVHTHNRASDACNLKCPQRMPELIYYKDLLLVQQKLFKTPKTGKRRHHTTTTIPIHLTNEIETNKWAHLGEI